MRRTVLAISVAALALVWSAARVSAQSEKTATGTVTAVAADSVTVKVGTQDMKFAVDNSTTVTARGAGTKTRKAEAAGTKPKVTELLSVGSNVEVKYHETGGTMHAASIRTIASAGKGGGSMSEEKPAAKTASGTVKNVAEQSLTISRAGKDETFTVDKSTKVVGKGAGTKSSASGGRVAITDVVSNGDRVTVTYDSMGGSMVAKEVRVNSKGSMAPKK